MSSKSKFIHITRQSLQNWDVAAMARKRDGAESIVASEKQLLKSRRKMMPDNADSSDLWVFGYGSLIFNPIITHDQSLIVQIHGYHRRFCLWTQIGRGSPECPGLVISLDYGGSCIGVDYRLRPDTAIKELDLLWRREMLTLSYNARWVRFHTPKGVKRGVAFVVERKHPSYAPPIPFEDTVKTVATSTGFNGHCSDYLFDTINSMKKCGMRDAAMDKLAIAVSERLASSA